MSAADRLGDFDGSVLVCCGDMPLIRRKTYEALCETHFAEKNDCTILTGTTDLPLPYGRIVRGADGGFLRVVEERDCTPEERQIDELNSGVCIFRAAGLLDALGKLRNANAQGEYYLTDVPAILLQQGARVGICKRELGMEIIGVNTPEQLSEVEKAVRLGY